MTEYRIHDPSKGIIGPVRVDTARDLVAAGAVHDGVWVSRDGGPFLPLKAFEELAVTPPAPREADPQPTYTGDLGKNTFFKVFHRFHVTRSVGLLVVQRDGRRKDIFMEAGQPVFVSSNILQERFGEFLVGRGDIDRHELEVALASMHSDRNRLGHTLIRLGLLDTQAVIEALRAQQIVRLVELCTWNAGRYQFFEGQHYTGDKVDLQLEVPALITRAARGLDHQQLETRLANWLPAIPTRAPGHLGELDALGLSADEKKVVDAIAGRRTVRQLVEELGTDEAHRRVVLMVVYLLWEIDAVTFHR